MWHAALAFRVPKRSFLAWPGAQIAKQLASRAALRPRNRRELFEIHDVDMNVVKL